MQLTYRGICYTPAKVIDSVATQRIVHYRGVAYSTDRITTAATSLQCQLQFMGKTYCKTLLY